MFGMKGWRHVDISELSQIDDGVLGVANSDMFITTAVQADFYAQRISMGQPGWENKLNDLVTGYVASGHSSVAIASELLVELGQEEGRAMATMNHARMSQQRVREAALAFNLLATGSTWQPVVKSGFPYRSRNWLEWCNKYIETMRGAARDLESFDFSAARSYEMAIDDLVMIREAFGSEAFFPNAQEQKNGCLWGLRRS